MTTPIPEKLKNINDQDAPRSIVMTDDDRRKLDYEKTSELITLLTEIRFRLLTFLPVATGAAAFFATTASNPMLSFVLGTLGFAVTLGIMLYDQRNTELYGTQVRRAKLLEQQLRLPALAPKIPQGGPFMGRTPRTRKLFGIQAGHDRGLAIIYAASLAVWAYLMTSAFVTLLRIAAPIDQLIPVTVPLNSLIGIGVAMITASYTWHELEQLDHPTRDELILDAQIKEAFNTASHGRSTL